MSSAVVTVQDQIQADWDNRELIQVITTSIMRIAHFLNNFDMSARSVPGCRCFAGCSTGVV